MRKNLIIENALTPAEQEQLLDWLDCGTYHQVRERLAKPRPDGFGLDVCMSTLERFLGRARAAEAPADHDEAVSQARVLAAQPPEPDLLESSVLGLIRQRFFQAALSNKVSPQELKHLCSILFKLKADARDERKLKVLEEKSASLVDNPSPGLPAEFEEALNLAYSDRK